MKERPILFSAPMARAIREGRKTQTRRVLKASPYLGDIEYRMGDAIMGPNGKPMYCPYGHAGDRLWVRESFWSDKTTKAFKWYVNEVFTPDRERDHCHLTPGIFMPRKLARMTLEVTNVRVERLCQISLEDAQAEGVKSKGDYALLWDELNGDGAYMLNPRVWVVEFVEFRKVA